MSEFVAKLLNTYAASQETVDTKHFIYIHSKWRDDDSILELQLLDTMTGKVYKGQEAQLTDIADELEIAPALYVAECRKALSAKNNNAAFECKLEQSSFKLSKSISEDAILVYLNVPLTEVTNDNYRLLDTATALLAVKQEPGSGNSATGLGVQNTSQNNEALAALWQLQKEKDLLEDRLLKRFMLLLQEKKQRIVELEERLAAVAPRASTEADAGETDFGAQTQPLSP